MKKWIFLLALCAAGQHAAVYGQTLGDSTQMLAWNRLAKPGSTLRGLKVRDELKISARDFFTDCKAALGTVARDEFRLLRTNTDDLGMTHYRYQQFYRGYRIEGALYTLHEQQGRVATANGRILPAFKAEEPPAAVAEEKALQYALELVPTKNYLWLDKKTEEALKERTNNREASFYPKGELVPLREAVKITWEALAGLLTVIIIVGGVIGGIFTATESASIAVVWAFFVTMFIYRDYRWSQLPQLLVGVVRTVAMVMIVIGFAAAFAYLMTLMQIPAKATALLLSVSDDKYAVLILINIMLLVLGTFMDMAPLLLICTPILLPVATMLGINHVHFGILMMLNLSIGLVTPPVGTTLFVGCAIGKVPIEKASRELWPFWLAMLLVLLLVTYIPALTLWIPSLLYKGISY